MEGRTRVIVHARRKTKLDVTGQTTKHGGEISTKWKKMTSTRYYKSRKTNIRHNKYEKLETMDISMRVKRLQLQQHKSTEAKNTTLFQIEGPLAAD